MKLQCNIEQVTLVAESQVNKQVLLSEYELNPLT